VMNRPIPKMEPRAGCILRDLDRKKKGNTEGGEKNNGKKEPESEKARTTAREKINTNQNTNSGEIPRECKVEKKERN